MAGTRAKALAAVVGIGLVAALTACGAQDGGTSSTEGTDATLKYGTTLAAPSGFNPYNAASNLWLAIYYDSVLRLDEEGKVEANVAESWEVDGNIVTLNIREGLTFPDGTAEDADAVKASLDYGIESGQGANMGSTCYEYLRGATTAVEGNSVVLTLPQVMPGILEQLALCNGWIVMPSSLENVDALAATPEPTGPYDLDDSRTQEGQTYTLIRRDGYWNEDDYAYKTVVYTIYSDGTALANAAKTGDVDVTGQIFDPTDTTTGLTLLASTPDEFRGIYLTDVTGAVVPAFGDVRVRQAMQYAIDRESITTALYGKDAVPSAGVPSRPGYIGYDEGLAETYPYDVDKAKELMAEAGYADGFSVDVLVDASNEKFAQAISGYLAEIGITLKLSVSTDFITEMLTGKWPMVTANFTLSSAQYETYNAIIGENAFWNPNHNSNPDFEAALTRLSSLNTDDPKVEEIYTELNKEIAEQAWFLSPTIVPTVFGVNSETTKATAVSGMIYLPLYLIKPVG